ncbi:SIMPL domain-containing protein [Halalkalibacter urbisdiaboli]|uniref:SIMPL domain-containing protein n=1 Tax=Halalkalibacter urbisdiaboli TaxID=1960589 RepID=UPI0013FD2474|nr:SIMPL domain-containing protein [Halalkalibacter urbisdiaboli]
MKKKIIQVGTIIVVAALSLLLFSGSKEDTPTEVLAAGQDGTIIASGSGEVHAKPDVAYVHLGASALASSASEAQEEVNKNINALRKTLIEAGIDEKQIQTSRFNVYPEHQYNSDGTMSKDVRYRAEHILKVEFTDIDNLGAFIDKAASAGANRIEHVQFSLQNPETLEHEALKIAVEKAKAKADVLADSVGKKRGGVLQITDQAAQTNYPLKHFNEVATDEANDIGRAPTMIEAGEITISQQVDIVYRLN